MAEPVRKNSHDVWKKLATAVKESEFVQQESIYAKHELLVNEIETTDVSLSTTLRAVYDGEEHKVFMEHLDARLKHHDKEIERMCNYHYQGFIDSIRELLQVRNEAQNLKSEIEATNEELQKSSQILMKKGSELVTSRKIQRNIMAAVEHLELCLPVLEKFGKLREQMNDKRYYPALKTLEQLEHVYLPRVSRYRFSQMMSETIPKLREEIKEASMSDLKDFLENIRKHSPKIGQVAMRHAAELNNIDSGPSAQQPPKVIKKKKKRRAPKPPNPFTGEVEEEDAVEDNDEEDDANPFLQPTESEEGEELSAQDLVDFSPVYRCFHIYTVLGARETFVDYYRRQRRKQARLALQPPTNMHASVEHYRVYFQEVVGFLVVEDHILNTTSGLVDRGYMDELWDMCISKIVAVLRTHTAYCTDATLLLQIKNVIILFSHTLKSYGFTAGKLYDLLVEVRDQYNEIIMQKWIQVFQEIFAQDNYTAISVQTQEEYLDVTSKYPYKDEEFEKSPFPKTFPFSQFVPKIYIQVKEYIYACLKFSEDLHLSHSEVNDMIRKSANILLTRTLGGCLSELIRRPELTLLQLIQISINMNYLEQSCEYLEQFISNITGADRESVHVTKLHGTAMFKDARSEAEDQIYYKLNKKIDDILELASYEWTLPEPKGHASGYLVDLIAFLQSTFMSFTNLPDMVTKTKSTFINDKVARTALMSACKHLAQRMMDFLLDNEVKAISLGALHQLNLDLMQCEQFANSEPVPGCNDGTLQLAFIDLRQLLDLFTTEDWSAYLADFGKLDCKYLRVPGQRAITLLEKVNTADRKKIFTFKKNERDKKKLIETVLRQLRQLVNESQHQN
ncbi:exocyst complex component 6B isoform X2 [Lingula anatina]|uniref:Exocyst complex component n=1 Tax=Lingula anatina TaxID=7574 RepID=A0A1S3I3C8_LINAN|nr:exocyst complex component 6B isoform X2 [Lingula anatina]|eukprot:XP_013391854.1 exocyst complex component 6B isoform X2 [Lingula anatina]